jgi:hypothetical protein
MLTEEVDVQQYPLPSYPIDDEEQDSFDKAQEVIARWVRKTLLSDKSLHDDDLQQQQQCRQWYRDSLCSTWYVLYRLCIAACNRKGRGAWLCSSCCAVARNRCRVVTVNTLLTCAKCLCICCSCCQATISWLQGAHCWRLGARQVPGAARVRHRHRHQRHHLGGAALPKERGATAELQQPVCLVFVLLLDSKFIQRLCFGCPDSFKSGGCY